MGVRAFHFTDCTHLPLAASPQPVDTLRLDIFTLCWQRFGSFLHFPPCGAQQLTFGSSLLQRQSQRRCKLHESAWDLGSASVWLQLNRNCIGMRHSFFVCVGGLKCKIGLSVC